jgi:hypothetical protein
MAAFYREEAFDHADNNRARLVIRLEDLHVLICVVEDVGELATVQHGGEYQPNYK